MRAEGRGRKEERRDKAVAAGPDGREKGDDPLFSWFEARAPDITRFWQPHHARYVSGVETVRVNR